MDLTRQSIPKDMPLFLRISATDWLEEEPNMDSWKVDDTVRLAGILAEKGVDLLDVSSGGIHPKQKVKTGPGYQAVSVHLVFSLPKSIAITDILSSPLPKLSKKS